MKNLRNSVLSMLLVSFGAIANDELKIGVSVGFDSIDYTLTQTYLDAEFGSAQANYAVERNEAVPTEGNMKYLSPTLTLDARYGRHGVSLKRANGDFAGFREATLMPNQGYLYTNYSRENDDPRRVETSLTYSFKINNNSLVISKITFYFKNLKVFSFYTLAFFYRLTSLSEKESAFIHVGKKVISKSI